MTTLGLAGIAGSVIDYRNGCGVSAVAVGVNSAFIAGYAIYGLGLAGHMFSESNNPVLLSLCAITGIGLIGNGVILAYILRQFSDRRRRIGTPLLLFLVFMASGLALVFTASALTVLSRSITPHVRQQISYLGGGTHVLGGVAGRTHRNRACSRSSFSEPREQREPGT